jgi:hypothetical protein
VLEAEVPWNEEMDLPTRRRTESIVGLASSAQNKYKVTNCAHLQAIRCLELLLHPFERIPSSTTTGTTQGSHQRDETLEIGRRVL